MPMVIYEALQYPALSPTYMAVQLADSTIRYPEGIVENILVRVRDSFILANFVVMDIGISEVATNFLGSRQRP